MMMSTNIEKIASALTDGSSWRRNHRSSPFSSPPTTSLAEEFLINFASMLLLWVCLVHLVGRIGTWFARAFWSRPIPIDVAYIPSKLPHPNPPGSALPFDVPLSLATNEQIDAFVAFRGCDDGDDDDRGHHGREDREGNMQRRLQRVANAAAEYKGELYQQRTMKWIDDHFRLRRTDLKYPYVGAHWNGWSSFYIETAPHIRNMFLSSMTIIFEHAINGLALPILYLTTRDEMYYLMALHGELAYMTYASSLILASYVLGRDVSIEQMHVAVWPLLLVHHLATIALVGGCIYVEGLDGGAGGGGEGEGEGEGGKDDGPPRDLVCEVLLAMLGFTSSLHYLGQILDFSPLAHANAPYTRFCNHVFCLISQLLFRGIFWCRICYLSVLHCLRLLGVGAAAIVALMLFLFTLFNIDFVKFHVKATKACWIKIRREKVDKTC